MPNIKEFFTGTPEEVSANETIARLAQKTNLRLREKRQYEEAQRISRRLFLRQLGSIGAVVTILAGAAVFSSDQPFGRKPNVPDNPPITDPLYREVIKHRTSFLPEPLFQQVMNDMIAQEQFPSLVSTAKLLLENHQNPRNMSQYSGILPHAKPIPVGFNELGGPVAVFSGYGGTRSTAEPVRLKRKDSDEEVSFTGVVVDPNETSSSVVLNTALIDLKASPWVLRLMIAKEGSHPFYFPSVKKQMEIELGQSYDVPQDPMIRDILMATAMFSHSPAVKLPAISQNFTRVPNFVDYAGFGHIALDLASMKDQGLLSPMDQAILTYNVEGVDNAIRSGIIVRDAQDPTKFRWENSSPTSDNWYDIMEEVHQRLGQTT